MVSPTTHRSLDGVELLQQHSLQNHRHLRQADPAGWVAKMDRIAVLGGGADAQGHSHSSREFPGVYGHTGCVNALSWSNDGTLLASGSDDTRICLWKIGQEPQSTLQNPDIVNYHPSLGMGLSSIIHTGHRANIFSVKFSPTSSNTLYSCAGDHEVRVFDLSTPSALSSSTTYRSKGREWTEYPNRPLSSPSESQGALIRVFKCHRGRVKRISTEPASDACFLTCSEDGTVRQHDLRVGHTCKRDCPPPLCDYRPLGMGLYSLSTSFLRPELFVVAGTSQYAYLHDRRMAPRTIYEQWGVPSNPRDLTQCVRRFGPAVPPLVPGPAEDPSENEDEDEDEDVPGVAMPPHILAARARARKARMRARAARRAGSSENHVTAAKLSSTNGRELLLTYSGGGVCLYDIFDDPEPRHKPRGIVEAADTRKRPHTEEASTGTTTKSGTTLDKASVREGRIRARNALSLPAPVQSGSGSSAQSALEAASLPISNEATSTSTSIRRPEERSDFVVSSSLAGDSHLERVVEPEPNSESEETFQPILSQATSGQGSDTRSAEQAEPPGWRGFEIRVNDDGEIEMDVEEGSGPLERDEPGEMNRQGYEQLLAAAAGPTTTNAASGDSSQSSSSSEEEESDDDEDLDEDEDEDSEDGISSSDDPDSITTVSSDGHVPLVRPHRLCSGHRNVDTVKDVNFGGADDSLILSGSDDGNLFIYSKASSELLAIIEADESVVNVMQYHPYLPIIAVSGIDSSVKLIGPTSAKEKKFSRLQQKEEITKKNRDESWTSEGLAVPHSALINLLSRAVGQEEGEEGTRQTTRRIPISMLLQMARQGELDEEGEGQDCVVM